MFSELAHSILLFFWGLGRRTCGNLVPQPGIRPAPPTLEVQSLNHWTAREIPYSIILKKKNFYLKFPIINIIFKNYLFIYGCVGSSFLCEGFL